MEEIAQLVSRTPDVEDLEHAMTLVRQSGQLVVDLLRSALDPPRLAEVTGRSYRHPNGFAKVVLHDGGPDGTSVRLHVWPAIENASPEDLATRRDSAPHGHRWNFASTVIAGSGLFVEEFAVERVDDAVVVDAAEVLWDALVFEPSVTSTPVRVGKARLRSREYWVRDPVRDIYWCDVDDVHTVGPIDAGMTATLVLQGPEVRSTAPVFRRPDGPPDPGRRPLDERTVAELIVGVIAEITGEVRPKRTSRHDPPSTYRAIPVGPSTSELRSCGRPTL